MVNNRQNYTPQKRSGKRKALPSAYSGSSKNIEQLRRSAPQEKYNSSSRVPVQKRTSQQNQNRRPPRKKNRYSKRFKMLITIIILFSILIVGNGIGKGIQKKNASYSKADSQNDISSFSISTSISSQNEESTTSEAKTETSTQKSEESTTKVYSEETTVFVNPQDENWQLLLVNKSHKLPDDYRPNISPIIDGQSVKADSRIKDAFSSMYQAAKQNGIILTPYSAYISRDRQNDAYNNRLNYFASTGLSAEDAKKKTEMQILPGGFSESTLGLSVDIINTSTDFASTNEYHWLTENAHNYGFILRYPENKTEITGMTFAPWHWRFVGNDAAKIIKEQDICLEEYLKTN